MFLSCVSFLSVVWFLLQYRLELSELVSVVVLGKQERSCVCCIYIIHPWCTSPEFAHILKSLAQFKHNFGALILRPTNAHFTYFKKNKLSFFQRADLWKIVFNIRWVQNADCRMHCKNMQKILSKFTTLENGTWKTDWWSMFLSKLDQNHAALPKFIAHVTSQCYERLELNELGISWKLMATV